MPRVIMKQSISSLSGLGVGVADALSADVGTTNGMVLTSAMQAALIAYLGEDHVWTAQQSFADFYLLDNGTATYKAVDIFNGAIRVNGTAIGGGSLTVTEVDGSPSLTATTLRFPNGTVTDAGGGVAALSVLPSSVTKAELSAAVSNGDVYFVGDGINETIGATTRNTGAFTSVAVGTTTATTGAVRLANSEIITARNAANSANVDLLQLNASNVIQIGGATNAVSLNTFWQTNTGTGALNATSASYPLSFGNAAFLYGPSANTLEQYNSTNAQTLNVYGTRTDSSNYRRLRFGSTTAGAFSITAEGLGTGLSGNNLSLSSSGKTFLNHDSSNGWLYIQPNGNLSSGLIYCGGNQFRVASDWTLYACSTTDAGGTVDTSFSRSSAGVWKMGTGGNNALGSLLLTNLTASGTVAIAQASSTYALGVTGNCDAAALGPVYVKSSGGSNVGTALTLDATDNAGGKKWSFISTGASAGPGAGVFAVFNGTDIRYEWLTLANGHTQFGRAMYTDLLARIAIQPEATTTKGLVVRGLASHTANYFETQTSAGTTEFSVAPGGNVTASGTVTVGSGTPIARVLSATATLDFPSIASNDTHTLTITVTGAVAGDSVFLGCPAGLDAGLIFCASVTATNTVTVRMHNSSGGSTDPASATFRATVMQF